MVFERCPSRPQIAVFDEWAIIGISSIRCLDESSLNSHRIKHALNTVALLLCVYKMTTISHCYASVFWFSVTFCSVGSRIFGLLKHVGQGTNRAYVSCGMQSGCEHIYFQALLLLRDNNGLLMD